MTNPARTTGRITDHEVYLDSLSGLRRTTFRLKARLDEEALLHSAAEGYLDACIDAGVSILQFGEEGNLTEADIDKARSKMDDAYEIFEAVAQPHFE